MRTKTEKILGVMNVLAWIAFIGLCIEAGGVLVSWGIKVLSKIKLSTPFTSLEQISFCILGTWVLAMIKNGHTHWVLDRVPGLQLPLISGEFIVMAGVVFVTAQIFKKGVEIQTENELAV